MVASSNKKLENDSGAKEIDVHTFCRLLENPRLPDALDLLTPEVPEARKTSLDPYS